MLALGSHMELKEGSHREHLVGNRLEDNPVVDNQLVENPVVGNLPVGSLLEDNLLVDNLLASNPLVGLRKELHAAEKALLKTIYIFDSTQ